MFRTTGDSTTGDDDDDDDDDGGPGTINGLHLEAGANTPEWRTKWARGGGTNYSAAQLGPTGFTEAGNFIARPFAAIGGAFPLLHATFYAPGAPRSAWAGLQFKW